MGKRYVLPTFEELELEKAGLTRNYPKTIKGVWNPAISMMFSLIHDDLPALKEMGVNTIRIPIKYVYEAENNGFTLRFGGPNVGPPVMDSHGSMITGEKVDRVFIDWIVKAKKAGFAVEIFPQYLDPPSVRKIPNLDAFDDFAVEQARKWATIAEEYNVEYFAPTHEYEFWFGREQGLSQGYANERTDRWLRSALAEVRPIFNGKITYQFSDFAYINQPIPSTQGIDIPGICFTIPKSAIVRQEQELIARYVQGRLNMGKAIAMNNNVQWTVSEFFLSNQTEEQTVELFKIVSEEYKKSLDDKNAPIGFTFYGWNMPDCKVKDSEIIPYMTQFFKDLDSAE